MGDSSSLVLSNETTTVNIVQDRENIFPRELAYQNINLAIEDILGLLKSVVCRSLRPRLDLIESRGKVWGEWISLGPDWVEIGCSCVLALGKGDELVASAFDDSERNEVVRHWNHVSATPKDFLPATLGLRGEELKEEHTFGLFSWWMEMQLGKV